MKTVDYIFDGLAIVQDGEHLKYGTDALLLSAFARGGARKKAVDLGCGTGAIALALRHTGKAASVVGEEIDPGAAALARESVQTNGYSDSVTVWEGDFNFPERGFLGAFDFAVSNPPYMKTSGKRSALDSVNAARHEVYCDISSVCRSAARQVKFGGDFFVVYRPDRISDLFAALRENTFEPKRVTFVCARFELAPCLVLVEAKKNGAAGCNVTPVFFISDEEKMKKVYGGGSI